MMKCLVVYDGGMRISAKCSLFILFIILELPQGKCTRASTTFVPILALSKPRQDTIVLLK